MADWTVEYKAKVREFIAKRGRPVRFEKRYDFQDDDEVSVYGWVDNGPDDHTRGWGGEPAECRWVVPEGVRLYERTYNLFDNTFTDNKDEHGVNVTGCHCACGKYSDVTLRWVGSLAEILHEILELTGYRPEVVL
jgi:hypothetical protein